MDDKTLQALKQLYLEAEERQRDAYRKAVWMEKHLYDADSAGEFDSRLATLKAHEEVLQHLSAEAMIARAQYAAAGMRIR